MIQYMFKKPVRSPVAENIEYWKGKHKKGL